MDKKAIIASNGESMKRTDMQSSAFLPPVTLFAFVSLFLYNFRDKGQTLSDRWKFSSRSQSFRSSDSFFGVLHKGFLSLLLLAVCYILLNYRFSGFCETVEWLKL